ncbi:MAG: Na/Pi cotransporter family protein [Bacilli bacterium]|nr:Na/Pi cotransporter family protein [Bacilli bacterium]
MKILLNFILSTCLFIYGLQLFSTSFGNIQSKIKLVLEHYTKSAKRGIILGTIVTALIQSSSIITSITVGLVNQNVLSFHNSIGIMMGANLGTCITSWITSLLSFDTTNISPYLNINTYSPFLLLIGLIFYFKKKKRLSNLLIGYSLFIFGLSMIGTNLNLLKDYKIFKDIIESLNSPLLGLLIGLVTTCLVQSSSATVAILQAISIKSTINYYMAIPIILGENIGSCITTIIASIGTCKNARKVAYSHLFYNIIGTIIFIIIFYISKYLNFKFLYYKVNSLSIALIHTLFNFLSIIIFYPFINIFEKFINKITK